MSVTLPSYHDDDHGSPHGHAADCSRFGRRRRSQTSARLGSGWRIDCFPTPYPLYHASSLPLPRIIPGVGAETSEAAKPKQGFGAGRRVGVDILFVVRALLSSSLDP